MTNEAKLLRIYCMYVLSWDAEVCIAKLAKLCGQEQAVIVSKYWENKLLQNLKKELDPKLGKKLNRKQVAVATVAYIDQDVDFLLRGLEAYK